MGTGYIFELLCKSAADKQSGYSADMQQTCRLQNWKPQISVSAAGLGLGLMKQPRYIF